ncbi:MAG TPA: DUF2892 domain-containing protein [Burkholderiaceae bacterium]|nr:DUF2892 domain-containing protein [Burkholderiaceae bacterium]
MKKNIGSLDKTIRLIAALALFSLFFVFPDDRKWFGLLGFAPLLISAVGWCPLYTILGINTCKR